MLRSPRASRRVGTTVGVLALVVLAGCSGFGVGDVTDGDETPAGGTGADAPVETLSDAVTTEARESSVTVHVDTRVSGNGTTVVENATVRFGPDGSVYAERSRRLPGSNVSTTLVESYTERNVTLSRYTTADSNVTTYEHATAERRAGLDVDRLSSQFEFTTERVDDSTHRFTVDSPEQVAGETPVDGTVEDVSVVAVVESGLLTELRYELDVATDDGVVEYRTVRTVSDRGSTTVSEPGWLSEARQRTGAPTGDD